MKSGAFIRKQMLGLSKAVLLVCGNV